MPAVYVSPGGSASYPALQTGTHADQVAVNAAPSASPGVNFDSLTGTTNFYVQGSSPNTAAFGVYKQITQAQRAYDGSDTMRGGQCTVNIATDVDHNDPTFAPTSIISRG